jgi:hypothetical protein
MASKCHSDAYIADAHHAYQDKNLAKSSCYFAGNFGAVGVKGILR